MVGRSTAVCAASIIVVALTGCIHTVSGPGYAPRVSPAQMPGATRVIYIGKHYGQPADFDARLKAALSHEFGGDVEVEDSDTRQDEGDIGLWPPGTPAPREGQTTVLIRAEDIFRCGTPGQLMAGASLLTVGILPYLDDGSLLWITEVYDGPGHRVGLFPFQVSWGRYGWLPLVPFLPLNMVWRAVRGDEHDYFLRVFPSHLTWQLGWLVYEPPPRQPTPPPTTPGPLPPEKLRH